jgi:gluconolactonase
MICQYKLPTIHANFCNALSALLLLGAALQVQAQVKMEDEETAKNLIEPAAKVEKLAGDMKFLEGPVWVASKKAVIFSDIPNSKLMQWSAKDGLQEYRKTEAANGNVLDAEGRIVSCQHAGRNVVREEKDGKITVVVDHADGKKFNSPNDLAIKSDGSIWFTDPPYGLPKDAKKEQPGNDVHRLAPDGKTVTTVSKEFNMPNGIVFSPDETVLYIADSGKPGRVGAFKVQDNGTLSSALWWADGGSDGIRVDEKGNLYTTAGDGVRIYSPAGKKIATISVPEVPANICFGGDDGKTLFITARTSLYSVPVKVAGAKMKAK